MSRSDGSNEKAGGVVGSHGGKVKSNVTSAARLRRLLGDVFLEGEEERPTHVDMVTGVKGVPSTPGELNWVGEVGREEAGSEVVKMGYGLCVNERIWKRVWTRPRQRI
jgi:hypothetical protein